MVVDILLKFSRFPEKNALHLELSLVHLSGQPSFIDLALTAPINLNISSTGDRNYQDPETFFKWPDLSKFRNLKTLKLFGLDGDVRRLGQEVAKVLLASPRLKALGLSMHLNSYFCIYREFGGDTHPMLLKIIVDSMQNERPGIAPQLDLDELILGLGALPVTNLATRLHPIPGDVSRLTSLSRLQALRLMNGDVGPQLDPGLSNSILQFAAETFYSCASLKRLTVDVMGEDVVDLIVHLRSLSSSLTELEVGRDEFSDQGHLDFGSYLIGEHWSKLHLGTVPLATIKFFEMGSNEIFRALEELSLYFGRDGHKKMSRMEPEEYEQWVSFSSLLSTRGIVSYRFAASSSLSTRRTA